MKFNPHKILTIWSVDPGQTTGWAELALKDTFVALVDSSVVPDYSFEALQTVMEQLDPETCVIVMERPPNQGNDPKLTALCGKIQGFCEDRGFNVLTVYPGLWKPFMKQIKNLPLITDIHDLRHTQDAFAMGCFVARTKFKIKDIKV